MGLAEGFSVDLDALQPAVDGVEDTLAAMATRKVSDIDVPVEAFGHDRLGKTVSDFCERWQIGVGHLGSDGREIVDRLRASLRNYQSVDRASADRFDALQRRLDESGPS